MTALLAIASAFSGWSWVDVYVAVESIAIASLLGVAVFGVAMRFDPATTDPATGARGLAGGTGAGANDGDEQ